ncbi:tail fiber assembly protein [Klebsiella oxytoca]
MSKYNTELPLAQLDTSGLNTVAGWITVYNVEPQQREFQSVTMEYLAVGVGLPAFSYPDKPELPGDGLAIVRSADQQSWEFVPDYRGVTAYNKKTGMPETVAIVGDLPDSLTLQAPVTPYDKWDGHAWVTDTEAQHADEVAAAERQKQALLTEAQQQIAGWQTDLQLGIISDVDKDKLIAWREYIKAVQDINIGLAPNIIWPDTPDI